MSADRDPVEELLASISDGSAADWDAAGRAGDAAGRRRLDSLRDVARIADFHRGLQRAGADRDAPERWGDLLLLERLGTGARAEVYRAWDPRLQREVALKLLPDGASDATLIEEGRAAARIRHPHVVSIHGVDRRDGRVGLWMELIRGTNLEQEVQLRGPLAPAEAKRLGVEIGSALAATHAAALLHRDVKPANVMRDAEGRFVLADFGLGIRFDGAAPPPGFLSGTPLYLAPELVAGAPASPRSDVYALGLTLWFALAARHPIEAESLAELRSAVERGPKLRLREARPGVPEALAAIVEKAIAADPERRYASASALIEALETSRLDARAGTSVPRWVTVAAVAALIGAAGFGVWRARSVREPAVEPAPSVAAPTPATTAYAVEAAFLRRDREGWTRIVTGDRVRPGDRLSLEVRSSRPAWFYVLNEDDHGERYLLFPQPSFDVRNPIAADSTFVLPGTVGGDEHAWIVTSAGGREYLLVVASPQPVPEIEADLGRLPAPSPGRPIEYARVGDAAVERLRGVGGVAPLPADAARPAPRSRAFDRFRALAGQERGVQGIWIRQIILENPPR